MKLHSISENSNQGWRPLHEDAHTFSHMYIHMFKREHVIYSRLVFGSHGESKWEGLPYLTYWNYPFLVVSLMIDFMLCFTITTSDSCCLKPHLVFVYVHLHQYHFIPDRCNFRSELLNIATKFSPVLLALGVCVFLFSRTPICNSKTLNFCVFKLPLELGIALC